MDVKKIMSEIEKMQKQLWALSKEVGSIESTGGGGNVDLSTVQDDIEDLQNDKVDKVFGKTLTSNDFTTTLKNKLEGIDLTTIENDIDNLQTKKVDVIIGMGLSSNNFTDALELKLEGVEENANCYILPSNVAKTSDIPDSLWQMEEDENHRVVTDDEKTIWNSKQNAIPSGSLLTQSDRNNLNNLSAVATSGDFDDLSNRPILVVDGKVLRITI